MMAELRAAEVMPGGTSGSRDDGFSLVRFTVGPAEQLTAASFDVLACTPSWLARRVADSGPVAGRHHLVVDDVVVKTVKEFWYERLRGLQADDWPTLVSMLSRLGRPVGFREVTGELAAAVHSAFLLDGERPDCGAAWLRLMVGPVGEHGVESFDVCLCTPDWLSKQVCAHGSWTGRHHLVLNRVDVDLTTDCLRHMVEGKRARTWMELATELGEIGAWEFEDYRPRTARTNS